LLLSKIEELLENQKRFSQLKKELEIYQEQHYEAKTKMPSTVNIKLQDLICQSEVN